MKMRLIDADALIRRLKDHADGTGNWYKSAIDTAVMFVEKATTIQPDAPMVMTLEEIKDGESYWFSAGKEFVTRPVICVHREDDARKPYITFVWQFGTFSWESEDYGKTWICWTARPTEEQREAAKWA